MGETVTGQWIGRGAELLGLEGEVKMEQFDSIRQGIDPATGEFLRQRQSADRYRIDGKKLATARNLYDFTISAPKAISVQAIEDPRLIAAHKTAVAETAVEMESVAGARIRMEGANDTRITSNLVIARYDHDTSRELDPQLHSHLVAANLTYDGAEGRWKALQASAIYAQREYLSEVYRNALAREVTKLGYALRIASNTAKIAASVLQASPKPRSKNTVSGVPSVIRRYPNSSTGTDDCHRMRKSRCSSATPGLRSWRKSAPLMSKRGNLPA